MADDGLVEFGRSYTAAWCSRDPARVAEHYTPEGSLTINDAEPAVGRIAIAAAAEAFMVAFPDLGLTMDDLRVEPGATTYHWTFTGTNTGPDGTGNRVRFSGFEEWTLDPGGLIARSLGSFDQAEYDHQLAHGVDTADG